ncbi:hypothetical protein DL765_005742 [Monosporascus sp. GIB2]|nr:hypothetical protein DL765_005742 [Monosporascus sp. GIB2]
MYGAFPQHPSYVPYVPRPASLFLLRLFSALLNKGFLCVLARAGRRPGVGPLHRLLGSVVLPELFGWWRRHERDCAGWEKCGHRDEWFGTLVFWAGLAVATLLDSELAELYRGLRCGRACDDGVGSEGHLSDTALADITAEVLADAYRWKYPEANFPWDESFEDHDLPSPCVDRQGAVRLGL